LHSTIPADIPYLPAGQFAQTGGLPGFDLQSGKVYLPGEQIVQEVCDIHILVKHYAKVFPERFKQVFALYLWIITIHLLLYMI
jgi:hypothetical protein